MKNHLPTGTQNAFNFLWFTQFSQSLKKCCFAWFSLFLVIFTNAQKTDTFTNTGAGTWSAPFGVTSVTVEVWGGGGGGQGVKLNGSSATGGGGSGGGFVKSTITVIPGTTYNLFVGSGGDGSESTFNNGNSSWFVSNSTILAVGGKGSESFAVASAGSGNLAPTSGNIGGTTISTYGGDGGTPTSNTSVSGGGGASAGNIKGNNAAADVGGSAPANGYAGANGSNTNGVQGNPGGIGAGGSGAKKGTGGATPNGGLGGNGQIKITYTCPTFSAGSNQTLAACSTTTTLAATAPSSPAAGVWTVVSGSGTVTTSTFATSGVTGIIPGTPLVLRWTVTNGNCGSSFNDVTITSPVGPGCWTYCTPTATTNDATGITNVTFNTINNSTTVSTAYTDTGISTNVISSTTYPLSVSVNTSGNFTVFVKAWIDWNNNGIFTDPGEEYDLGSAKNVNNVASTLSPLGISIPIVTGNFKMRVRATYNVAPIPCTNQNYSEAEDYILLVAAPVPCVIPTAQPTGLNLTAVSASQINGTFTTASPTSSGYLVIRSTSSTLSGNPIDGTNYTAGNVLGGGIVVYSGPLTSFSDTGLSASTRYYYFVISYNASPCTGGTKYRTATPLTGNRITLCPGVSGLAVDEVLSNSGTISWVGTGTFVVEYGASGYTPGTGTTAGASGTISSTNASSPFTITGLAGTTSYDVYVRQSCVNGGANTKVSFTTLCTPSVGTVNAPQIYIKDVKFLGSLVDDTNNTSSFSITGYTDFTSVNPKAKQIPGGGVNVFTETVGTYTSGGQQSPPRIKAWVDWDKNGTFDATELEYDSSIGVEKATFGFVVPATSAPGDYRIRIRVANGNTVFNSCGATNFGETEDYTFTVIVNCGAVISSAVDGFTCGTGSATLSATGNGTSYRWYTSEFGGTAIEGATTATYNTPSISTTTIYYVTAINGTCESVKRYPVKAKVNPSANITFTNSQPDLCGAKSEMILSSQGDKEEATLVTEDFENGFLKFASSTITSTTAANDALTQWSVQTSTMKRTVGTWRPAISSGLGANKFALATSDVSGISGVDTGLTLVKSINTTNFLNLKMDLEIYYSNYRPYINDDLIVESSTTGNDPWTAVQTVKSIQGSGTRFAKLTLDLNSLIGINNLFIRLRYKTGVSAAPESARNGWGDGVAIDNIRIYGDRPLLTPFTWSAPGIDFYNADCTTPLVGKAVSVCIKPNASLLETYTTYNITATATLQNGCTGSGTIGFTNNSKIWNPASGTDWSSSNWKPDTIPPTANKCVIIKKPVVLSNGNGLAKNITIESAGSLTIKKDRTLTVTDYIKNESTLLAPNEKNLVLETDGNLIQTNNGAANSGRMTAQRLVNGLRYNPGSAVDYVYWSSPVAGQKTKNTSGKTDGFSPGTANTNFFYYNESNDYFYETGDSNFRLGRGYAVQAERDQGVTYNKTYDFKGTPNNGDIEFPLDFTNDTHGYNLVGNPYPSNIDFNQLSLENSGLIYNTAWFWTNNVYTANQMGSGYTGNNYAVYNGAGGNPATYNPQSQYQGNLVPNGIIKVGQGFIIQAKMAGSLSFKNKYDDSHILRVNSTGNFYSKNSTQKNRFWIKLLSPSQLANSQLIAYVPGATDGFEQDYDAEAFDDYSDLFYSVIPGKKLLIQGKSSAFTEEDKVTLGANFFQNGSYTIVLENAEGIFNESQNIYLKDKQEGIITNLSQGSYTFSATKGDNASRFEIIYKPEIVLVTDSKVRNSVEVYRDSDDFVVRAVNKKITAIQVFDASGILIYSVTPNSLQTVIPADKLLNSIYVLKINQGEIITTTKIIK